MIVKPLKTAAIAAVCALALAFTGCGSNQSNQSDTQSQEATASTVKVTDARGEVEIPSNPQRIVDISGNSDILSILGYTVVGTANSDAYDYTKYPTYLEETLKGATILGYSMQKTMDVEAILALNPDMIIISSVQESMYQQLQEVAPTVMIELAQTDWTQDLMQVAGIFHKTEQAESWLSSYKEKAQEVGNTVKQTYGEDKTYLSFLASAGNIYIFDAAGMGSILYEDMGLKKPAGMPEQSDISLPVVTYEGLAAIDADYMIAVGTDEDLKNLYASSIWKNMNAVKAGHVIELPSSPYFNMGYSSIGRLMFLDQMTGLMESVNE